jgi:hypothetical protein
MTLGIALVVIFILYLIDKHNRWRQAIKLVCGLAALGVTAFGLFYAYASYTDNRAKKLSEANIAKMQPAWDCENRNTPGNESLVGSHYQSYNVPQAVENACEKDPNVVIPTLFIPDASSTVAPPALAPHPKTVLETRHIRWVKTEYFGEPPTEELKCGDGKGAMLGKVDFVDNVWLADYGQSNYSAARHGTIEKAKQDVEAHANFDLCDK